MRSWRVTEPRQRMALRLVALGYPLVVVPALLSLFPFRLERGVPRRPGAPRRGPLVGGPAPRRRAVRGLARRLRRPRRAALPHGPPAARPRPAEAAPGAGGARPASPRPPSPQVPALAAALGMRAAAGPVPRPRSAGPLLHGRPAARDRGLPRRAAAPRPPRSSAPRSPTSSPTSRATTPPPRWVVMGGAGAHVLQPGVPGPLPRHRPGRGVARRRARGGRLRRPARARERAHQAPPRDHLGRPAPGPPDAPPRRGPRRAARARPLPRRRGRAAGACSTGRLHPLPYLRARVTIAAASLTTLLFFVV